MALFSKKEKYIPKVGITGEGTDYNVYHMALVEKFIGFAIGFAGGFVAFYIMFYAMIVSLIAGICIGIFVVPLYNKYLNNKRQRLLLMQFRDMLDSLSGSFSSGKNTHDAFVDCCNDLKMTYGDNSPMVRELFIIVNGLHNNYVIEDLLRDLAVRCNIDDINSFANTFAVCNRKGGDLKKVVTESRDIINDKIEIEMEIQTTLAANKNDINIMSIMPFLVVAMMGAMGQDQITANTPINVVVKLLAMGMFVLAYYIGLKITNIKV